MACHDTYFKYTHIYTFENMMIHLSKVLQNVEMSYQVINLCDKKQTLWGLF